MRKSIEHKGFSFFDYWDRENQKIKLDLEKNIYYFEKPANINQESLIFYEIPYSVELFQPIVNKIIQKSIKIQFKDEDIKKESLKKFFFSIWEELPILEPFRIDKLIKIFRKKILSGSDKKKYAIVAIILFSNQIILFHSKSSFIQELGYWEKNILEKDSKKYILDKLNFHNLLRASIIRFEKKNFFLTLYDFNFEISKSHADFWDLNISYVNDIRSKVWERDKGICQECGKILSKSKKINILNKILEELHALKEIEIFNWESNCLICKKKTPRVSYFIDFEFTYSIGDIEKLDKFLMEKYPFVKMDFKNAMEQEVITNTCIHCASSQGNWFIRKELFDLIYEGLDKFLNIKIPNNLTLDDLNINKIKPMFQQYEEFERFGHVHHIDGDKINNNLENLVLLCPSCHRKAEIKRN
ncbi:MAG: HNH endonuclease [Promethearchaeota archaeon]